MPLGWKNVRNGRADSLSPLALASARLEARNAQTLDWQCEVSRIAAPTGAEQARAAWMAERFRAVGWNVITTDAAGNVIARRDASEALPGHATPRSAMRPDAATEVSAIKISGPLIAPLIDPLITPRSDLPQEAATPLPAIWCCAHLDTVFKISDPLITREGSRLQGPGISDNGRGLAALLALADALHTADVRTARPIVMACTTGEEGLGDLRGMKQLMRDAFPQPHAVIAIDGAGDDRIVHSALGSTRWRITFRGAGGHSWADFGVANPVHAAAAVVSALHAVVLPRDPRTTLTVARIGGGESINSIPREAWIEVDLRSTATGVLKDIERLLHDSVGRITKSENVRFSAGAPTLTSEIVLIGQRPSGAVPESDPLVQLAMRETRAMGAQPRLATASTDASVPISLGISAIAIGAGGRGGGTHTPAEWYDDTNGVAGLQRALRIIVKAAGLL
jgi:tripeptide aminopeptidase